MSARSLNKVTLIGNLTRDPEVRYTPSGTAICTFGLATNRSWNPTDGSGAREETEYHKIVAWSKLAEICGQLLSKGRKVYCEGRLQTRKWTGQDGVERSTTEIVIDNMIVLSPPKDGYDNSGQAGYQNYSAPAADSGAGSSDDTATSAPATDDAPAEEEKPADPEAPAEEPVADEVNVDDIPF